MSCKVLQQVLLLLVMVVSSLLAEQCLPDPKMPCVTKCNGTSFDLRRIFDFPVKIKTQYAEDYYEWSPCRGQHCGFNDKENQSAICRGTYMSLGHYNMPVFLIQQHDPLVFTIEYPNGDYYSMSVFRFMENKDIFNTIVTAIGQNPMAEYHFQVTGRCIGQEGCGVPDSKKLSHDKL